MIVPGACFIPRAGIDPYRSDVVWHFRFDDDLVDTTGNLTLTQSNTRFASDNPFGGSGKCLETNYGYVTPSYVYKTAGTVDIGTGDFTIEMWAKMKPWDGLHHWLYENGTSVNGQISYVKDGANFGYATLAGRINTSAITNEVWTWLVFQRESGVISMWIDGVKQAGTITDSMNLINFAAGRMGGADPSKYLRIVEHRGTKRARYSGETIAIPTTPFPNS